MTRTDRRHGFTLVEMLVVISIIVVLVAILFPVFTSSRHKAKMVRCRANMGELVSALQDYKRQWHRFPQRPAYDTTNQIYTGGFSALYPNFIDDFGAMVCPDDRTVFDVQDEAKQKRYCSYNGLIVRTEDRMAANAWDFATDTDTGDQKITYNYNGYNQMGWDRDTALQPPTDPKPAWLDRSWKYYPRLLNIYAPEYTVVTHCTFHRDFYSKSAEERDTYIQLSSDHETLLVESWQTVDAGGSLFEKQD